jgi:hypothetical protein
MPRKEQKPKRWDLARGETGLLFPRDKEPEPWPEWLSKTFVNVHLVQEDPIQLREELLDARVEWWGPIDTLLYTIEREATKVFQKDASLEKIERMSEAEFRDLFGYESLAPKQANAIAALRSIAMIRSKFFRLHNNGYYYPTEDAEADPTTAKMLLEMTLLVLAAIRGELWESVWPHTEHGAERQRQVQEFSRAGVEKRKKCISKIQALCREKASSRRGTIRSRALYVQRHWSEWSKGRPPSLTSIRKYITSKK